MTTAISMHIRGIIPPDDKWRRMKSVWDACAAAEITPPAEVVAYFGGEPPDPAGLFFDLYGHSAVSRYQHEGQDGLEVDVKKLPANVTKFRVFIAY